MTIEAERKPPCISPAKKRQLGLILLVPSTIATIVSATLFWLNLNSDDPKASLFWTSDALNVFGWTTFCASTVLRHRGINQMKPEVSHTSIDNGANLAPLLSGQTPKKPCCNAHCLTWLASGINFVATAVYLAWFISQDVIFCKHESNPSEIIEATLASLPAYAILLVTSVILFRVAHKRKLTEPNETNRSISHSIARLEEADNPERKRSESKRVPKSHHRVTGGSGTAPLVGSINGGDHLSSSPLDLTGSLV